MKNTFSNLFKACKPIFWPFVGAALALLNVGCHIFPPMPAVVQDMGPRYHPSNVYRRSDELSPQIRRVALLPLVTPTAAATAYLQSGVERLSPLIYGEVVKCKRFEVIPVSPEQLRQWTGKIGWGSEEALPPDFFKEIADATGCDAVLFCQLTRCQPYQPLAVGWKFSLVANPQPGLTDIRQIREDILWSADEVLDAGDPSVANAARDYYSLHLHNETPAGDPTMILNSPTRFGQYTMAALLDTMPVRPGMLEKGRKSKHDSR